MANNHGKRVFLYFLCLNWKIASQVHDHIVHHGGGNKAFRNIVAQYKKGYVNTASPLKRKLVIKQVQAHLEEKGFRFVEKRNGLWFEAPAKKSRNKIAQALREGAQLRTIVKVDPIPRAVPSQDTTAQATSSSSSLGGASIDLPVEEGLPQAVANVASKVSSYLSALPVHIASDFHMILPPARADKIVLEEQSADSVESDFDLIPLPSNGFSVVGDGSAVNGIELEEQYVGLFLEWLGLLKI